MSGRNIKIIGFVAIVLGLFVSFEMSFAGEYLQRGEAVKIVVEKFRLEEKNENFLKKCRDEIEYCIFVFSAKSRFDGISTSPLKLYPDVLMNNRYSKYINVASLLEVVEGYTESRQSPFKPHKFISRSEAFDMLRRTFELNSQDGQEKNNVRQNGLSFLTPAKVTQDNITSSDKNLLTFLPVINENNRNELISKEEFLIEVERLLKIGK